jgi:hypothetical protein
VALHSTALPPITSMPPIDVSQLEQWATVGYNKLELCAVDLRPVTRKAKRTQDTVMLAHAFDPAPALRALEPTLTDHSGLASTLLSNSAGRTLLLAALNLDALPCLSQLTTALAATLTPAARSAKTLITMPGTLRTRDSPVTTVWLVNNGGMASSGVPSRRGQRHHRTSGPQWTLREVHR